MHSRPSDTQKSENIAMATDLFPPSRPSRKRQGGGVGRREGGRGRGEGKRKEGKGRGEDREGGRERGGGEGWGGGKWEEGQGKEGREGERGEGREGKEREEKNIYEGRKEGLEKTGIPPSLALSRDVAFETNLYVK